MAQRKAIMPGARTPLVNEDGLIDNVWLRFLSDLYARTGGGPVDKVDLSTSAAVTAQASADAAAVSAAAAQASADSVEATADEIERRLNFNFESDIE